MAGRMRTLPADMQQAILAACRETPSILQELCHATGSVLQQLSHGLQQYLQQRQLPAALTAQAVEACNALCLALNSILSFSIKATADVRFHERRRRLSGIMHGTGGHTCSKQSKCFRRE
jgi:hypothetical protein